MQPNPGHYALADLELIVLNFSLITQNVDGLHQRAGNKNVIELHGNITRVRCLKGCGLFADWEDSSQGVPHCPSCGFNLRPDLIWFREMLPIQALQTASSAARSCNVFFSIGTSGVVQPANSLVYEAKRNGAVVVEINTETTLLTHELDFALQGKSCPS